MSKFIKIILVCSFIFLSLPSESTFALTTGTKSSDAVYREGGNVNYMDHAGVFHGKPAFDTTTNYVWEIKGYDYTIDLNKWSSFLGSKSYKGSYYKSAVSSDEWLQGDILYALEVMSSDPAITYTVFDQLVVSDKNGNNYVNFGEITDIRCDGVVEYSYELNNQWVWGPSNNGSYSGTSYHQDVSYVPYVKDHNNLGNSYPWKEISPYVQRGGPGDPLWLKFTTLRRR